jgi:ubiquitin carboxyl-terminal hydrolase L5
MSNNVRISESQNGENIDSEKSLRRSSRQTAATTVAKTREVSAETASTGSLSEPRRNPKRKAAEVARESINLPDNLLDEALRPLTPTDIEEWDGWVELESEPVSIAHSCVVSYHQIKHKLSLFGFIL